MTQMDSDMKKKLRIKWILFSLDGSSLSNCRLEYGNSVFYPELEYENDSKARVFNDSMSYAMRKND